MDLADRAQEDEARAVLQQEHLRLRQPQNAAPEEVHTHCEDCDIKLDKKRLIAMPTARRCVPCESAFESLRARGLA